jgi:peptidyl-prolyl cis-trans isomerase A (cyclophilin A)
MKHFNARRAQFGIRFGFIAAGAACLLAACGGGSSGSAPEPAVAGTSVSAMYSQKVVLRVTGSNVNTGLAASSTACTAPMTLSTATPYVSDASTAYYTCPTTALGAHAVTLTRGSDGSIAGTVDFTVPMPQVRMTVSIGPSVSGNLVFTLAPDKTPISVDNFLRYVHDGFYPGIVFHRVAINPVPFVIQGGAFRVSGDPLGILQPIPLEVNKGLSNVKWSLGMARTPDPNSATSQFYINLADNLNLDPSASSPGYAVFGVLTSGMELVDAITTTNCTPYSYTDSLGNLRVVTAAPECTPLNPYVVITSAVQTQ